MYILMFVQYYFNKKQMLSYLQTVKTLYVCIHISIILTPTPCVVPVVCFESYEPDGLWQCPSARSGRPDVSWSHWDWPPNPHPPPAFLLQLQKSSPHRGRGRDGLDAEGEHGLTCVGGRGCHSWLRDFGVPGGSGTQKTGSTPRQVLFDASASSHSPMGTREGCGAWGCCYHTSPPCPDQPLDTPAPLGLEVAPKHCGPLSETESWPNTSPVPAWWEGCPGSQHSAAGRRGSGEEIEYRERKSERHNINEQTLTDIKDSQFF